MKNLLKVILASLVVLCSGCSGTSSYADLIIMKDVQMGIEEYGIAFRSGSDMVGKVDAITNTLFDNGTISDLAKKYELTNQLVDEFKVGEEQEVSGESDYEYIKDKGKLVIGITDFKPMDYRDENGEWIGFDAEYAKYVCDELGVEPEFLEINWDTKEVALETKQIDCIWNGMTITDAIKNAADVTGAYMRNYQVVIVKDETLTSLESLNGKVVVAESGSAGEKAAKENQYLSIGYKPVESQSEALLQVKSGAADACVIDFVMAKSVVGNK